jgi:hypothetical protein
MSPRPIAPAAASLPARVLLAILLLAAVWSIVSVAQSGGVFDLTWYTVDGGGQAGPASAGGSFALNGTIGQPDAGPPLSGGAFGLAGGFWPGGGSPLYRVYLPVVVRNFR